MVMIYLEGGGDESSLKTECRHAFHELFKRAGFANRMPKVVPKGRRGAAFDAFKTACRDAVVGLFVILLVDSETVPAGSDAWAHLKVQDGLDRPSNATGDQAQLMVVCMETWLVADTGAFAKYFGKDFNEKPLPTTDLEKRSKSDVYGAIGKATISAIPKGKYGKARDSFKLLSQIDPVKLRKSCAWADRFFEALNKYC
ncbi:MAG: DUF4276 family protein [Tepidisphaeraceae bacterium]|jgi:hypothetical protein